MNAIKERIFEAVTEMDAAGAARLLEIIEHDFLDSSAGWGSIPEADPDEIDLQMLDEIEQNPDCHEFVSASEAKRILGL